MKISIIGAGGTIGYQLVNSLLYMAIPQMTELALVVHSSNSYLRLSSLLQDSLPVARDIQYTISNDCSNVANSNIILYCAGKSVPTNHSASAFNNRSALLNDNLNILNEYLSHIGNSCPNALFIMITNPVRSLIASAFSKTNMLPIGIGVTNDTLRLRNMVLKKFASLEISEEELKSIFVIGDHSNLDSLTYIDSLLSPRLRNALRDDPDKIWSSYKSTQDYKKHQLNMLEQISKVPSSITEAYDELSLLPALPASYFSHRLTHFTIKTAFSTSLAVLKLIELYISGSSEFISAEIMTTIDKHPTVVGIPIHFKNRIPVPMDVKYSDHEKKILQACIEKDNAIKEPA